MDLPGSTEEIIIDGKAISLAAFLGARSQWVPDNAVIPTRTHGIAEYRGRMVEVSFDKIDAVEFGQ